MREQEALTVGDKEPFDFYLSAFSLFQPLHRNAKVHAASLKGITQIIKFRYSVTFEVLLGILVLGAAAVLGITPPPQ